MRTMKIMLGALALMLGVQGGNAKPAAPASPKRLVIVDDDMIGLNGVPLLLLQSPDVEVLGITTTSGSVWRDTATAYALRTLEILGRTDVPVVPGATFPLYRPSQHASSLSKHLAGPVCTIISGRTAPFLTTAPSGARLP